MTTSTTVEARKPAPARALEPMAYRVRDLSRVSGIGRTTIFRLIREGKLDSTLIGRVRLVSREAAVALISGGEVA